MEELKNRKIKLNAEIDLEINILARENINKHIAARDADRIEKQFLEDQGWKKRPEIKIPESVILDDVRRRLGVSNPPEPEPEPAPVLLPKQAIIERIIETEVKQEIAGEIIGQATEAMDEASFSLEDFRKNNVELIEKFELETEKFAIYREKITKGFKEWIELNGFELN